METDMMGEADDRFSRKESPGDTAHRMLEVPCTLHPQAERTADALS